MRILSREIAAPKREITESIRPWSHDCTNRTSALPARFEVIYALRKRVVYWNGRAITLELLCNQLGLSYEEISLYIERTGSSPDEAIRCKLRRCSHGRHSYQYCKKFHSAPRGLEHSVR
jgi:hypothetical protein